MNGGKFGKYLALAILVVAFAYSSLRVFRHTEAKLIDPEVKVITFAHWQLEPGVREAFDAIAEDYMRLHPKVQVKQMPIPGRVWKQWLRTQLVGGNPPDLIELANYHNTDEMLARYFVPLTKYLAERNPYNKDEPDLRDLSWRKSFSAELIPEDTVHYYSANLMEYYGVPNAMVTVRIFYNRDIIKEVMGEDRVPVTYDEFLHWCKALNLYAKRTGKPIVPLAGSWFNALQLTGDMSSSMTQKLAIDIDYSHDLEFTTLEGLIAFTRGTWTLETPSVYRSLELIEGLGKYMPAGWAQMNRDDAMLQLLQGNVAMIPTGTWDAGGILQQAQFDVGAFKVPAISPDDPYFGGSTLGPISEANIFGAMAYGLTSASKDHALVIDFLRFMTSRRSNAKFAEISTWLPVIKGVPVPAVSESFRPIENGFIRGPTVRQLGSSATDVLMQNMYLLSGKDASAERYIEETRSIYKEVVPAEMRRMAKVYLETIRQKDSVMTALFELEKAKGLAWSKFDIVAAKQIQVESLRLQLLRTLEDNPME